MNNVCSLLTEAKRHVCILWARLGFVRRGSEFIDRLLLSVSSQYYWLFVLSRGLVGIGESSYSSISPTIIGDLFTSNKRTMMLSIFYLAIPVGRWGGSCWAVLVWKPFCRTSNSNNVCINIWTLSDLSSNNHNKINPFVQLTGLCFQ